MHSVLNMPPTGLLVWSSGVEKSLLCRADFLLHPLGCPNLVAGLSPCGGVRAWRAEAGLQQGNSSVGAQLQLLLSGFPWKHGKRDWGLMLEGRLTSGLWKCSWQWLLSLCSAFSCSSSLLPNLFFLLAEAPLKTLPELYAPSPIVSLHLSAEMPGANCFSWTSAHEPTYDLIQVQPLKTNDAPLSWIISILHDLVESYQTSHKWI